MTKYIGLFALLTLFLLYGPQATALRTSSVYHRMLIHDPVTLDPCLVQDVFSRTVTTQVFEGLTQFDSALRPIPAIAAEWEVSRDGRVWTFRLRHGVLFQNGREVTAQDFVYSWTRGVRPGTVTCRFFETFRHMTALRALDRYTLSIEFAEPYAPLLSALAATEAAVVPREAVEGREEAFAVAPIGAGPFRVAQWERGKQLLLVAHEHYYGDQPALAQIVFTIGGTFAEMFQRFLRGTLDETAIPADRKEAIALQSVYQQYQYIHQPILSLLYIGMNLHGAPFADVRVRQALTSAVDTEAIVQTIAQQAGSPATSILPPGMPGYDAHARTYPYDVTRARALLAEAGYPDGAGFPVIGLWSSSKSASAMAEMEAYQHYFAQIGVTLALHYEPDWPTYSHALHAGYYDMFRLSWSAVIPDPDDFLMRQLWSHGSSNWSYYHNPEVDALLHRAQREGDETRRIWFYHEIERRVMQDAPWIVQHSNMTDRLYQPYVHGVEMSVLGEWAVPMKRIWLE